MNSARQTPRSPILKPLPPPKPHGLSVVPLPPPLPRRALDVPDEAEATAVSDMPPELSKAARSDVRELRAPRPAAPRPGVAKPSVPPPVCGLVAPAAVLAAASGAASAAAPASGPAAGSGAATGPAAASGAATASVNRAEVASEVEMSAYLKPRSLVLARTLWFFALYVAADAIRWMGAMLTAAKARLAAEWRHAAIRAKAPRQAP